MNEIDWPTMIAIAVTGLVLIGCLGVGIAVLVVLPALQMVDELTGMLEDE